MANPNTHPLALTPALPSELLTYILSHQTHPTTVIICQSRSTFLSSLQRSMPNTVQRQPPVYIEQEVETPAKEGGDGVARRDADVEAEMDKEREREQERERDMEMETERKKALRHPLLILTPHQIVNSRFIKLVFMPTLSHLRAYLAVFPGGSKHDGDKQGLPARQFDKKGTRIPLLVVYGLVAMHRDTSEWSAQGLGNSVAALVEAGRRGGRGIVVFEERELEQGGDGGGDSDVERYEGRENKTGWGERLPMLNGSVKRDGLENEDGGWSGRTVEVGRVLGRWFGFERGEWDIED